jgi:hypothetical protein
LERSGGRVEADAPRGSADALDARTTARRADFSDSGSDVSDDLLDMPEWEEEVFFVRGRR